MLAVVISGSLRTFGDIWDGNEKYINSLGIPFKVFLHTWDQDFKTVRKVYKDNKIGGFAFGFRPKEYSGTSKSIDLKAIRKTVPSATVMIEKFLEDEITEELKIPSKNENVLFQNMVNSAAMYMGISRVFQMALGDKNVDEFTHFLRLRTDFQFHEAIPRDCLESDIYFCGPIVDTGYGKVSDQCFFVKPEIATVMATLEYKVAEHTSQNGWGIDSNMPFYGERILAYFLKTFTESCKFEYFPTIGQIKRPPIQTIQDQNSFNWIYELLRFNISVIKSRFRYLARKFFGYFN